MHYGCKYICITIPDEFGGFRHYSTKPILEVETNLELLILCDDLLIESEVVFRSHFESMPRKNVSFLIHDTLYNLSESEIL